MSILSSTATGVYSRIYINGIHDYIAYKYAKIYVDVLYGQGQPKDLSVFIKITQTIPLGLDKSSIAKISFSFIDVDYKKLVEKMTIQKFVEIYTNNCLVLIGNELRKFMEPRSINEKESRFDIVSDSVMNCWLDDDNKKSKHNFV